MDSILSSSFFFLLPSYYFSMYFTDGQDHRVMSHKIASQSDQMGAVRPLHTHHPLEISIQQG